MKDASSPPLVKDERASGRAVGSESASIASADASAANGRRAVDRMRAVAAAAAGVIRAGSRERLRVVLEEACRDVIPFDAFFVQAYDPSTRTFHGFGGVDAGLESPKNVVPAEGTPNGRVVAERRSLLTLRSDDPAAQGAHLTGTGRRSESVIRCPILSGDAVLGVLSVHSYTPDLYTKEDVEAVEVVASLAATALENLRLAEERHQAEEALRDRERQLREAQRIARLGTWRWSVGQERVAWSDEMFKAYGIEPTADRTISFDRFVERLHPDDRDALLARVDETLNTGEPYEIVHRLVRPDGEVRTLLAQGDAVRNDAGEVIELFGTGRDVTEERAAENELRRAHEELEQRVEARTRDLKASEESYRGLFDNLTELVYVQALDGTFLNVNEAVVREYGYGRDELVGRSPAILAAPGLVDVEDTMRRFAKAVDGVPQRFEWWGRRKDGSIFPKEVVLKRSSYFGEDVVIAVARNIAERKDAEEALRRSEEHFRRLIENASDLISILEADGTIRYESTAVMWMLGYQPEEMEGKNAFDFLAPEDVAPTQQRFADLLRNPDRPVSAEFRFRHKDGSYRFIEAIGIPLDPAHPEEGVVVNSRDITERKRTESTLRLQKTLLEAQGEASIDGILVVSDAGKILSFNQRFVDLWRIPDEVVESRSDDAAIAAVLSQVADPIVFQERIAHLYDHPDEKARDEILLKDGRVFDRYSAPVVSHEGDYYGRIWFFRDVTAEKRHERELDEARKDAEAARVRASRYAKSLERELEFGRQIQEGLLPASLPERDGWEIGVRFRPVWQVAGDFYDAFELPSGHVGLIIADVSGKGVGAALFMALFQSLLRASAERAGGTVLGRVGGDGGPAAASSSGIRRGASDAAAEAILRESVSSTNSYITRVHRHAHMFASAFFGLLDTESGVLAYVNAGHERPVIVRADGAVDRLETTGPALGLLSDAPFGVETVSLAPGDTLLAFTDGVTEARSDSRDFFTEERLLDLFQGPEASASDLLSRIEEAVLSFAGDAAPSDDLTLLAARRKPVRRA